MPALLSRCHSKAMEANGSRRACDGFTVVLCCQGARFVHFLGPCLLALSACPRWAQANCRSVVISVGVSPAGTELQRMVSSNPGAEKTNVRLIGSVPIFFKLTQVLADCF
jgi:hypothetical protein